MHNFIILGCDTDAIKFCKQDMTPFTKEEQQHLIDEINSQLPELIQFENDGFYDCILVIKTKNYVMKSGDKLKIKGSALKATTKEPALKEFLDTCIDYLVNDKQTELQTLYNKYVLEANHVTDIKRWASRKTISSKTMESTRANETKIIQSLNGTDFSEGDRVYLFFKQDGSLSTINNYDGKNYDKDVMLEKLFKTIKIFSTVLDINQFPNYSLKKNKHTLLELIND